jgi:hypothetical protein
MISSYISQMRQLHFSMLGDLEAEIYMRQPKDFINEGQKHLVCKLKHSLNVWVK